VLTVTLAGIARSLTPLTRGTPGFGQPSWSPDGKSIAFVANLNSTSAIEVASAEGARARRVSADPACHHS
jgi:Tol biopolymer transport system component